MMKALAALWDQLEDQRQRMLAMVENLSTEQLQSAPGPDRWSILRVLQHVVMGEAGMRQSEAELRDNPLREKLRPGKMVGIVKEFLEKDLVDAVPDPSMEPDGNTTLEELRSLWQDERRAMAVMLDSVKEENCDGVMFSHLAADPLTAFQMLEIAKAHLSTHTRQIERLRKDLTA